MHSRAFGARAIASLVASTTLAATIAATIAVPAHAAPDGSAVVISEVYGGGGNAGAPYTHDFIEFFNPTAQEISLEGYSVAYLAANGNTGGTAPLSGSIPAGGHYLIQAKAGTNSGLALSSPDATTELAMGAKQGSVRLSKGAEVIDTVGYGGASVFEGSPAPAASNKFSVARDAAGTDTDDNSADFSTGAPTPQSSGVGNTEPTEPGEPTDPTNPTDPENPAEPGTITEISAIQGSGAHSPLQDQTVTTTGVVTGVWSEGGRNGFSMQTGGTGDSVPEASPAIFVYMGSSPTAAYPTIGDSVEVTGKVSEYFDSTQITASSADYLEEALPPVTALSLPELPAGDEAREPLEHMLIQPGAHTVTNNYELNKFGTVGLAPGTQALRQPSDVHLPSTDPNSPLQQLAAENAARLITLDDGRTRNYLDGDQNTALPYITQDGGSTITSLRTTDVVHFQHPVILDYSHEAWRFQPTAPLTGANSAADLPISWEDSRADELNALDVEGDYTVAAFNVLNYFTTLGKDVGATPFTDKDGNPVTVKSGKTRGAYTESAFNDQQTKIVAAINGLDADVVALSEIEDGYAVTGDIAKRDQAVAHLTAELNKNGGNWDYVRSPEEVPANPDVIRTAFIYKLDRVKPVGPSRIFDDTRFSGTAREPLAQEFAATDDKVTETFVAVANHFKSKGSVANGDADHGDGQGNNANLRNAQAQAVLDHLYKQEDWKDKAIFVMGDLNTYSREDALSLFRSNGYTVPAEKYDADASYQFDGLLGSLDHVLANDTASAKLRDAQVWNINADEPLAFEYSRRNYNAVDLLDASPFRSSDHDPVKVGFNLEGSSAVNPPEDNDEDISLSSGSSATSAPLVAALVAALVAIPGIAVILGSLRATLPPALVEALPKPLRAFLGL